MNPLWEDKGTKVSDMRFATERAFRRSVLKAELTFAPLSSHRGDHRVFKTLKNQIKSVQNQKFRFIFFADDKELKPYI